MCACLCVLLTYCVSFIGECHTNKNNFNFNFDRHESQGKNEKTFSGTEGARCEIQGSQLPGGSAER